MQKFTTDLEKQLWEMLYRSQMALAVMCLDEANRNLEDPQDWPCGQQWYELVGSSHAIFSRRAREKAGIDHNIYLGILRNNEDAAEISGSIYDELASRSYPNTLTER
jgi:hypothetical protein